jgi:hypothetical protein
MVGQYLPKKSKFTFCCSALKKQIFLTSKQGLNDIYTGSATPNYAADNLSSSFEDFFTNDQNPE